MMILLGQHGQRQDFQRGLEYIRLAAQSCDQNAPQGAYVSLYETDRFDALGANMLYRYMECCLPGNFLK
jgi:hypothetical protein